MHPDDPAVADILRHAKVARIATVSRNGRPHVNPLYFVTGRGKIYLGTVDRTLAALKELEFDHRTGKVSDEDDRSMVGELRRAAADALRALDSGTPRADVRDRP
jgi:general stress protein 26